MLTLIFGMRASEPPLGPSKRLKRPGLIGLSEGGSNTKIYTQNSPADESATYSGHEVYGGPELPK